jgi:hypothetical protein
MSDKLHKLGFLAGKLFAKTVNEVKPIDTNKETTKTDSTPVLDPEEKIKKVIELLDSKNTSQNIEDLLNRFEYESNEIIFKRGEYFNSATNEKVDGINNDLVNELGIKEINNHLHFIYKEKSLQILMVNETSGSNLEGDRYERHELIVIYNSICVLTLSVNKEFGTFADTYRVGNLYSLKSFKNGSWLDDLDYLIKSFKEHEHNLAILNRDEQKRKLADKLDLNPLD